LSIGFSDTTERRIASLDLLRGLAAFSVAIAHFLIYQNTAAGTAETISIIAVEVFFVLSGFVLAPQIVMCAQPGNHRMIGTFLVRRWMRTIPPFLLALACISVMAADVRPADVIRYAFYVQNLFSQANHHDFYPVAWSLAVEEWFYVVFPLILIGIVTVWGRANERDLVAFAIAFIVIVSCLRMFQGSPDHWGQSIRRIVAFRIDSIAVGFLLWLVLRHRPDAPRPSLVRAVAMFLSFAFAFYVTAQIPAGGTLAPALFPLAAALVGSTMIAFFITLEGPVRRSAATVTFFIYLGRISYSVYLFHLVVLMALPPTIPMHLVMYLSILTALTTALYWFYERPILAARPKYGSVAVPEARANEASNQSIP